MRRIFSDEVSMQYLPFFRHVWSMDDIIKRRKSHVRKLVEILGTERRLDHKCGVNTVTWWDEEGRQYSELSSGEQIRSM